jgi:hypothetical protein
MFDHADFFSSFMVLLLLAFLFLSAARSTLYIKRNRDSLLPGLSGPNLCLVILAYC